MTLMVTVLYILACVGTVEAIRAEPEVANPSYLSAYFKFIQQTLPKIVHANTEPTIFDLLLAKHENATQDLVFSRLKLTQSEIVKLDSRQKASLYASLMQFKTSINERLSALAKAILNTTSEHEAFPDTLLFTADQSPYSFKSAILEPVVHTIHKAEQFDETNTVNTLASLDGLKVRQSHNLVKV
jgi:hypothetical protein